MRGASSRERAARRVALSILKRLRGTPIVRHDKEWEMIYSPNPPYEILQTKLTIEAFWITQLP